MGKPKKVFIIASALTKQWYGYGGGESVIVKADDKEEAMRLAKEHLEKAYAKAGEHTNPEGVSLREDAELGDCDGESGVFGIVNYYE